MLKSTEIVLEQLIIGLLTLVIVDLFVWGTPLPQLESGENAYQSFFYGVLIVIVAYAAGIVVDRWSDTLLEQMERRIRNKVYSKSTSPRMKEVSPPIEPFVRINIRKYGDRIADYHDYLRRRMRITRSLTCLTPALFLALALFDYQCQSQEVARRAIGGGVFAYYALLLIINIFERPSELFKIPKNSPNFDDESRSRYYCDPGIIGLILYGIFGILLLIYLHLRVSSLNMNRVILFIGGLLLTYLIGWAWCRISQTFFTFIRNYNRFELEK